MRAASRVKRALCGAGSYPLGGLLRSSIASFCLFEYAASLLGMVVTPETAVPRQIMDDFKDFAIIE
jgi:hypothetical protein